MKKLAIAAVALFVFTCAAQAAELPVEALAANVVKLSGIERSLAALPETLRAQSDLLAATRLPDEKPSAEDAALSAFDPEAARIRLIRYMAANCDAGTLSKVLVWLESPVGQKMTAAEDAEKGLELQAELLKYLTEIRKTPPNPERIVSIRKLVQVSGQLEMVAKVFEATAASVAAAMNDGASNPEIDDLIHAKVKEAWVPMEKQFLQQLVAGDLYVYRGVSDDELSAYIAFLESEAGKRYTKVVVDGYGQILEDLILESKKDLIEEIKMQSLGDEDEACTESGEGVAGVPAELK